jgi:phosphoribosylaminoimidazole-succinocarboxamide synthase
MSTLLETTIPGLPVKRGKVRDVYDLGDRLLIVATDRISAFDWVLPTGIPDKGRILNTLSAFWFDRVGVPHHVISTDVDALGELGLDERTRTDLAGRVTLAKKANVVPFECVVRGYLSGSGWKEYRQTGRVCGEILPEGLLESDRIPTIFTPATKAETGHDENVPFSVMAGAVGRDLAETLRDRSVRLYEHAAAYALQRGVILADTKFEWGIEPKTKEILLIDEILTPDSSRYWPKAEYQPGGAQPSFDKQFVRDWLERSGWDKSSVPPELPDDVVAKTRAKYIQAFEILTEHAFPWT